MTSKMRDGILARKRKDGSTSWLVKYDGASDPITGERQIFWRTVRGTRRDAEKERRRLLRQVDTGEHVAPDAMTLQQFADHWLEHIAPRRAKAGRTRQRYGELLRGYVYPALGAIKVQKINDRMIDKLYADLLAGGGKGGRKLSARTVFHVHRVLSEVLRKATKARIVNRNPCDDVDAPSPDPTPAQAFTAKEADTLLAALEGKPLLPIVRLALVTGARRGEIAGLKWDDVDEDKRTLTFRRSIEKVGKVLGEKLPKTPRSIRTIRLSENDVTILREHWRAQAEIALKLGVRLPLDAYLFPGSIERPSAPIDPDRLTQNFAKVLERLKIKRRGLSFHSLRHTNATLLLWKKVDDKVVARRLGHSTTKQTRDTYQHLIEEMEEGAAEIAGAIVAGSKPTSA